MFDRVLAVEHGADLRFDLIGRDVGEESETAAIHADDRNLRRREIARDAEQAAVAADDDQQIADGAECLALFDAMRTHFGSIAAVAVSNTIVTLRERRNCSSVTTDSTMLRLPLRAISPTVLKVICGGCQRADDAEYTRASSVQFACGSATRWCKFGADPVLEIRGASAQACPPMDRRRAWAAHWKTVTSKC